MGQLEAGENHGPLRAEHYGFGLFLNGKPIFFTPAYPAGTPGLPAEQEVLTTDVPAMKPGDVLEFLEGVTDQYGRLYIGNSWSLFVDADGMLSPETTGAVDEAEQMIGSDSPEGQTLEAYLNGAKIKN